MKWGRVEVPEIDQLPLESKLRGRVHGPTGLRWVQVQSEYPRESDLTYLLSPEGTAWGARIFSSEDVDNRLTKRVQAALGMGSREFFDAPLATRRAKEEELATTEGIFIIVYATEPVEGLDPIPWTEEYRDVLVLMALRHELYYRGAPFPSIVTIKAEQIPAALRGTFESPVWRAAR